MGFGKGGRLRGVVIKGSGPRASLPGEAEISTAIARPMPILLGYMVFRLKT